MGKVKEDTMRESPRGKSMLTLYNECPRKWAFKYIRGFRIDQIADYFITGGIVHEAQEQFYGQVHMTPQEGYDKALERAEQLIAEIDTERRERLGKLTKRFLEVWYENIGQYDLGHYTVVAVEEEKEILLYNGFRMTVRWDRALYDPDTKEIFISDTKTTGWSLEGTISNYMKDDQPKLYILSAVDLPWAKQLSGWRTDALYVNQGVQKARRSGIVMPTQYELEDVKRSYTALTDDIAFKIRQVDSGVPIGATFYRNSSNCRNKYGHACPHYDHCHKIDDLTYQPDGFSIDPWLAEGTIKEAFSTVED